MLIKSDINFCRSNPSIVRVNSKLLGGPNPKYKDLKQLKKNDHVGLVIDLRNHYFPNVISEKVKCFILGIKHSWRPFTLKNIFPEKKVFLEIADDVKKTPLDVYIHCRSGRHRTKYALEATQIINDGKSVNDSINEITNCEDYWKIRSGKIRKTRELKLSSLGKNLDNFKRMFSCIN